MTAIMASEDGVAPSYAEMEIRGAVDAAIRKGHAVDVAALVAEWGAIAGGAERVEAIISEENARAKEERAERERQTVAAAAGREFKDADEAIAKKDIEDAAIAVLRDDPITFIQDTFGTVHSGDPEVAKVLSVAVGAQSCINTMGIQPAIGGPKGGGKTSIAMSFVHLLPPEWVLKGSFSSKAIFYHSIQPGTIIFSDDTTLPPELNDLVKRSMSDFQNPTVHYSLDKNRNPIPLTIPPRVMWLFTSIGDQGDEQLNDRQFKMSVSPDVNADSNYETFLKQRAATGMADYPLSRNVRICREMVRQVKGHLFAVEMPMLLYVTFTEKGNRRLIRTFIDFVAGVAVLRFMQRRQYHNPDDPEGVIRLIATEADLKTAAEIYNVNRETKKFALTKDERALWEFIWNYGRRHDGSEIDSSGKAMYEHEIIERYALSDGNRKRDGTRTAVRRLLYGRPDRGHPGGITEKVPGCYRTDDYVKSGEKRPKKGLIVCTIGPELADYADFYTFDHNGWQKDPNFVLDSSCPNSSHVSQVFPLHGNKGTPLHNARNEK